MFRALGMTAAAILFAGGALADGHGAKVIAADQDVSAGTVAADMVTAPKNGWLVVHRTDGKKPGPVVGHAPLRAGENTDVAAILTEEVKPGEKLMLMIHAEDGGSNTGIFEYTLGAKEDGPIKPNGELVMQVITVQ